MSYLLISHGFFVKFRISQVPRFL